MYLTVMITIQQPLFASDFCLVYFFVLQCQSLKINSINLPLADLLMLRTRTVKLVKAGMLRSNTGSTDPISSSILYVDWLNFNIVTA